MANQPKTHDRYPDQSLAAQDTPHAEGDHNAHESSGGDRWIWAVWLIIAVISIGILPLTTRGLDMARAIASFCGFPV
jgi:Ca2+/H+ antiporter